MSSPVKAALVFSAALFAGTFFGATVAVSPAQADAIVQSGSAAQPVSEAYVPIDPNKKKPGEECKSNDECQKHHSCAKSPDSDKKVCTAPPRPKLPPGAVT